MLSDLFVFFWNNQSNFTKRYGSSCAGFSRAQLAQFLSNCFRSLISQRRIESGGVGERLKPAVLKTVRPERVSGVRIPPPPPSHKLLALNSTTPPPSIIFFNSTPHA